MRLKYIDRCKAIGIILIIFYHTVFLHNFSNSKYVINFVSLLMLPIFFVVSGILKYYHPIRLNKRFIYKRCIQLFVPYFIFGVISILVKIIFFRSGMSVYELTKNSVVLLLTLRGIDVLWFLPVLLFSEVLFLIFYKNKVLFLSLMVPFFFVPSYIVFQVNRFPHFVFSESLVLLTIYAGFIFILIGYNLISLIDFFYDKFIFQIIMVIIYVLGVTTFNSKIDLHYMKLGGNPLFYIFLSVVGSLELVIIFKHLDKYELKYIDWVGKNSLYYMCLHLGLGLTTIASGLIVSNELGYVLLSGFMYTIIQCLVLILPTICFSYLINWIYKKLLS